MARNLFINEKINREIQTFIESHLDEPLDFFQEKISDFLISKIYEVIGAIDNLYLIGSFSRKMGSLYSDVDFLYIGEKEKAEELNFRLRKIFRNYSLKTIANFEESNLIADEKNLVSLSQIIDRDGNRIDFKIDKNKIKNFILQENQVRHSKYNDFPGRLSFNIKYSPGGILDLIQVQALTEEKRLESEGRFLYKVRVLNQYYGESDIFQIHLVKKIAAHFKEFNSEKSFLKNLFQTLEVVFSEKRPEHMNRLRDLFIESGIKIGAKEFDVIKDYLEKTKGEISSPSYHLWNVKEHSMQIILEVIFFFNKFKDELALTEDDLQILIWAAFFHDLKKGEKESHSLLGSALVQEHGKNFNWEKDLIETVSWLVREHLTLVKFSFKSDPFESDFIKNLYLKGCYGKKAILLFVLSCADIKATNPQSFNIWKEKMLKTALDQILGAGTKIKEKIQKEIKNQKGIEILDFLSEKELSFVPIEILKKDLDAINVEGIEYYDVNDRIWIRLYKKLDEDGIIKNLIYNLSEAGAYVHTAIFKTLESGEVYNWVCIETGVGIKPFQKRFELISKNHQRDQFDNGHNQNEVVFSKIKKTFSTEDYAVVTFKGEDKKGVLYQAVKILNDHNLSIKWGHALTWGSEVEDVFGVYFKPDQGWTFLKDK